MLTNCIVQLSSIHGKGVFASTLIPQGSLVWELDKYLTFSTESIQEKPAYIHNLSYFDGQQYVLSLDGSQYTNHSCNPNTGWLTDTIMIAIRDIQPDEELTYDYATSETNPRYEIGWCCQCGDPACRGTITARDHLNPAFIERYRGLLPSWTLRSIAQSGITGS
jgi:uncharacterized protein